VAHDDLPEKRDLRGKKKTGPSGKKEKEFVRVKLPGNA
jgi:hypothetical protein